MQQAKEITHFLGTCLKYSGAVCLVGMACVGTVAIDLVLIAYAEKHHEHFLTGFILGMMLSPSRIDPLTLMVASPFASAIAIGLSLVLGVPTVGLAILAGWVAAVLIFAAGMYIEKLTEDKTYNPSYNSSFAY